MRRWCRPGCKLRETRARGRGGLRRARARHHQRGADRRDRTARPRRCRWSSRRWRRDLPDTTRCSSPSTDARLMLPYLAFAGPATVLLALASAQGRFSLTAFSPLLFNIALIAVMIALMLSHARRGLRRAGAGGDRRHRRPAATADAGARATAQPSRRRCASRFDAEMRGFFARAIPGMVASSGAATADRRRRDHRLVLAVGGVVALFRQPPDRAAARHGRRRHGHGADAGTDARAARRRQATRSRMRNRARWSLRPGWRCRRRSD